MKPIRLKVINFINPHWLNKAQYGTHFGLVVSGRVQVEGELLDFKSDGLPDGSELIVTYDRSLWCFVAFRRDEYLAEQERKERANEECQRATQEENRKRWALNREFNDYYHAKLPFKWIEEIKDVLSGLSENSNGDGANKRTVHHILCLEDVNIGRIKRDRLDFLCTSASGSNGKRWSGVMDLSDQEAVPRVSCKRCLEIADRIIKNKMEGSNEGKR